MTTLHKKFPLLVGGMESLLQDLDTILQQSNDWSDAQLQAKIEQYNRAAAVLNDTLRKAGALPENAMSTEILSEEEIRNLPPEFKEQLEKFTREVYHELFPPTYTDQFIMMVTGEEKLEDSQRWLLAVPNGLESIVTGVIDLARPSTWIQMYDSGKTLWNMSPEERATMGRTLKLVLDQSSTTDKFAPLLSILAACVFIGGGIARLGNIAKKLGYSANFIKTLNGLKWARMSTNLPKEFGKTAHLAVISGIVIPSIPPQSLSPKP